MRNRTKNTCARCGGNISYDGFCSDETCPFSDYKQNDGRGWSGHPSGDVPSWVDSHSVNCCICNELVDERECIPNTEDGGDICQDCQKRLNEE